MHTVHILSINIKNIIFFSNENFQFLKLKKNRFITCFRNVTHIDFCDSDEEDFKE